MDSEDWSGLVDQADLKRPLTLDNYFANQLAETRNPGIQERIRERISEVRPELEAMVQPGDIWWEWIQGTEKLMQSGGLALVRDGKIVWAKLDWIS